jgi:DNA-binding MarR family transcriptional regulator
MGVHVAKLFLTTLPTEAELQKLADNPAVDPLSMHSHILLRKLSSDFETNLENFFSQYNLSTGRFTLLMILKSAPNGLMPSEMAQKVGVTQATISGLINSLEKAELVKREVHERDGRSFVIRLTEKGVQLFENITPIYYGRVNQFWSSFDENEKRSLSLLFGRMIEGIGVIGSK